MTKIFQQAATGSDVQLGKRGPRIISSTSNVKFRNATNSSFVTGDIADPITSDNIANKRYVDSVSGTLGTATLDFGAFPGSFDTFINITGQTNILTTSFIEAWIAPKNTVDHSVDEHIVDAPKVFAANILSGIGFTIYALANYIPLFNDTEGPKMDQAARAYGAWNVAWRWR